jgi:hypothetical protein
VAELELHFHSALLCGIERALCIRIPARVLKGAGSV